ncbi:hypothetical protein NOR_07009 [Metarhizium rileyi]|uniref:Ima1 N-terminal domain-containing protein n=1 Tax=Metarhizium rileyi (strain RCEF 4871) TaxID=1649241 RepID=A0A166Z7L4_METRR|nr:hypothetical protein NOR_07009 [Metarhizium rileyi RCEF 4871]
MARFRGAKYLSCFYCGKRSGMKFDGTVRDFLCMHCDATNYLDENGEITDPPVATEREAAIVQYAAPQLAATLKTGDIFCQTCVKNQHLFTKSLAQYFPDDPSDPDYPELERNYYRYRRSLEKRYPQVCNNCAESVEDGIRQAGYTAKTDHLRRMMNLSRGPRTRKRTRLDWVNTLGKTLWRIGFVLQMVWHLVMFTQVLQQRDDGMYDPDERSVFATAVSFLKSAVSFLPTATKLIQWSLWTGVVAIWWNPHFVQMNRGFTRHLLGFTQWYSFQGLAIFFRFIFRSVADVNAQTAESGTAKLGAHVAMAAVTTVVYVLAGRSIRVDTTPLFATCDKSLRPQEATSSTQRKQDDRKTFSELVNDALDSPNATPQEPVMTERNPSSQSPYSPQRSQSSLQPGFGPTRPTETPARRTQQLQYDEEMDWAPITPQHRALNDDPTPSMNRFGQVNGHPSSPLEAKSPFWCKVPAAPTNPAQRLRKPLWPSAAKHEPIETGKAMFTRRGHQPTTAQTSVGSEAISGVEFKQPSFFAPQKDQDASSLADLLSQSFTLGQDQEETTDIITERRQIPASTRSVNHTTVKSNVGSIILTISLSIWLLVMFVHVPHAGEVQLTALLIAGIIALRGTADTSSMLANTTPGTAAYISCALGVAELAAICWVGSEVWTGQSDRVEAYGVGLLVSMLGHRTLKTVL